MAKKVLMPMHKPMLDSAEQISWLEGQGIAFHSFDREQARDFLENRTYFFKLKSYAKNYRKDAQGLYHGVDFGMLVELSLLDMHLRKAVLDLCLSIEHQLKVMLMRALSEDPDEDGYAIVRRLFAAYPDIEREVRHHADSATHDLQTHYPQDMPVWILIEICSYGSLIRLLDLYFGAKDEEAWKRLRRLIYSSKFLRNAAAHNNCLLNSLRTSYSRKGKPFHPTTSVLQRVRQIPGISKQAAGRNMNNHVIHDLIASLMLFESVCTSPAMADQVLHNFSGLLHGRFVRHKEWFQSDPLLANRYRFTVKVIDALSASELK